MTRLHRVSNERASVDADVVFVHGLGGDAFRTWQSKKEEGDAWPNWIAAEFPNVRVWTLEHASSPSKWARFVGWITRGRQAGHAMALPERSLQVLDLFTQAGLGAHPLIFIAHSLGGLLVKHVLRTAEDQTDNERMRLVVENTRGVLFLATPHCGAGLASLLHLFRAVFGSTVSIADLRAHEAHLLNLYNWYRQHAAVRGIRTASYYETKAVGGSLQIVNATSAQCGIGSDAVPLDEDHLSIAKPTSADAQVCQGARDLLRAVLAAPNVGARRSVRGSAEEVVASYRTPRRLPLELPPAAECHIGRSEELALLVDRLRSGRNTAVVGPAGFGKTALAAEAIRQVVSPSIVESPYSDGVVLLDLYKYRGLAEPAWNSLANTLAGAEHFERSPARERAVEACRARNALIVVEGGEEADGLDGRTTIAELFSVLSPQNRWLLLTRVSTQAAAAETVELNRVLSDVDARELLAALVKGKLDGELQESVLRLVQGHPLALTWAANLLAREDEEPKRLVDEWNGENLPTLRDPRQAEHTLEWLYNRSVRGMDTSARLCLDALGLLARAQVSSAAVAAGLGVTIEQVSAPLRSCVQRALLRRSVSAGCVEFTHVLGYRFARRERGADPLLRERLARHLSEELIGALERTTASDGAKLSGLLEHASALLRADDDHKLWAPLGRRLLYEIADLLEEQGRLDLVSVALDAVGEWLDRLKEAPPDVDHWLHMRCVLLVDKGDLLRLRGDLQGALGFYRGSLALMEDLLRQDTASPLWQRELSVSRERIGMVLKEMGDIESALAAYNEAVQVRRALLSSGEGLNRDSLLRDLGVSLVNVGLLNATKDEMDGAREALSEALDIRKDLHERNPTNGKFQRDAAVAYGILARVLANTENLDGASEAYATAATMLRSLVVNKATNLGWHRDLSVLLTAQAAFHKKRGDLTSAIRCAEESVAIDERLVASDATNALWRDDLGRSQALLAVLRQAPIDAPVDQGPVDLQGEHM
jgi:tetratricopeptide (TPR) repeat protein